MKSESINLHAKTMKILEEKLTKGKESAIQLQTLLQKPVTEQGLASCEELAMKILKSYSEALSMANSSAVDCSGSDESNHKKSKDRRGSYKRKRSSDSRITVCSTMEDGYAWRKYGQKNIFNSKYPRCYYRCSYKPQGCSAIKQVQKIKDVPLLYQVTYFNPHTCTDDDQFRLPHLIVQSDPMESNLLSFQATNIPFIKQEMHSPKSNIIDVSPPLQESKEDIMKSLNFSCSKWQCFIDPEFFGCGVMCPSGEKEEEGSGLYSCTSTSLQGLDMEMEVNQFGDINFDEI